MQHSMWIRIKNLMKKNWIFFASFFLVNHLYCHRICHINQTSNFQFCVNRYLYLKQVSTLFGGKNITVTRKPLNQWQENSSGSNNTSQFEHFCPENSNFMLIVIIIFDIIAVIVIVRARHFFCFVHFFNGHFNISSPKIVNARSQALAGNSIKLDDVHGGLRVYALFGCIFYE